MKIDLTAIVKLAEQVAQSYVDSTPSTVDNMILAIVEQLLAKVLPPQAGIAAMTANVKQLPPHVQAQVDALLETCRAAA